MRTFIVIGDGALVEIGLKRQLVKCRLRVPALFGIEWREDDVTQLLAQQLHRDWTQRTLLEHYFARTRLEEHCLQLSARFVILQSHE